MALDLKLSGATGSRQSNMAAVKPEVVITYLVDYIVSKFQRLHQHIRGLGTHINEIPFFCHSQIHTKNDYTFCNINI